MKIGSVIKYYRITNKMTQSALAKGICSISHLSKIENDTSLANEETLSLLLGRLGIDLKVEILQIDSIKTLITDLIEALIYLDKDEIELNYNKLITLQDFCLNTDQVNLFHLAIFKYYIYKQDLVNAKKINEILLKLQKNFKPLEEYYYCIFISSLYNTENTPSRSIATLIDFHNRPEISSLQTGEFYYQLSLNNSYINKSDNAIIYSKKAISFFQAESNFVKILYCQMILAINYSRVGLLVEAKETYKKILRNFKLLNNTEMYQHNLYNNALLLKKMKDYNEALNQFQICSNDFKKGTRNSILSMLNVIEIKLILGQGKNTKVIELIDEVIKYSNTLETKKYNLLAKQYRYRMVSPGKRLYNFLEKNFLPYMIKHKHYEEAKKVALELAEYSGVPTLYQSNQYYYKIYAEISNEENEN